MVGIIGALDYEIAGLLEKLVNQKSETLSNITFISGTIYGKDVVIAKCGVGKVFAAMCAQTMVLNYKPDYIINTGVAGALSRKLQVYDLVIATELVHHDLDITAFGEKLGLVPGLNIVELPCSEELVDDFSECATRLNINCHLGKIASGDQFVASTAKVEELIDNFDALACEMEGASIAQVCYVNGIAFIVIRCISDRADEKSNLDYHSFSCKAAQNSVTLILEYLRTKGSHTEL